MYKGKKVLAIIPARSGSKGLKDKNIKILDKKPLMAYTIEAAIESGIFEDIIVSTDSLKYAEIANKYGANTPFMRPESLSTDETTTQEVVMHALDFMERETRYDYFMILQPTSPFRNAEDIIKCMEKMISLQADSVISMCECEHPVEWCTSFNDDNKCLYGMSQSLNGRRQEKKMSYRLNGAMYLISTKFYRENKTMYGERSYAYIMSKEHSIDIDDIFDFKCAEALISVMDIKSEIKG